MKDKKLRLFSTKDIWLNFGAPFSLGVLLVLLISILKIEFKNKNIYLDSLFYTLETIGISLVVASIFSYISSTEEFVSKIKKLLHDIVINRDFLSNIDNESKKEVLSRLIKPSIEEKSAYKNIESYIENFIPKTLSITQKSVRSGYHVDATAQLNKDLNQIFITSEVHYRLYPTSAGFKDIEIAFLASEHKSQCTHVCITTPSGSIKNLKGADLIFSDVKHDLGEIRKASIQLSEFNASEAYLNITLGMIEYGSTHWQHICFSTLMPTDGFNYRLKCNDDIIIRHHNAFIFGAKMHITTESEKSIVFHCNEWLNEGSGIAILVAIPHESPNKSIFSDSAHALAKIGITTPDSQQPAELAESQ